MSPLMHRLLRKLAPRMPASIESRGIVLVLLAALSVGVPGFFAHRAFARHQEDRFGSSSAATLAVALQAYLDDAAGANPDCDAWINRLASEGSRVRWGGVFDESGEGLEFRRRTDLPREEIVEQIPFDSSSPTLRPLFVHGKASPRFALLTIPQVEQGTTFAAILDLGKRPPVAATLLLLGLAMVAGLGVALAWFQRGIQRPLQAVNRWVVALHRGLTEATLDDTAPTELRDLVRTIEGTQVDMHRWRVDAAQLRHSLDARVDARTRNMTRALHEASQDAETDSLTKLLNRRTLLNGAPQMVQEHGEADRELTVVLIDIDNFKTLNDALGHQAGDDLLAFLGDLIRATVRKRTDLAVRYGGDEIVLLLPDTDALQATAIAQRLHDLFAQRAKTIAGVDPPPGISAGVAALRQHRAASWEDLLRMADEAMYHAKQNRLGVAVAGETHTTGS